MKILVAIPKGDIRDTFIPPEVAERLESIGAVTWNDGFENWSGNELRDKLPGADACVTGWGCARFDENVLKGADRLKLVAHTGGSVSTLVSEAFFDRGLAVVSGNRLYAESVAEGTIAYMLSALRDIPFYAGEVQAGRWRTERSQSEGLLDQSVGLVGFGMVARYLAEMLKTFRVKVTAYDPFVGDGVLASLGVERVSLEDAVSKPKIISLHAARTPATYHLVSRELLKTVRDGAVFINTARGSVVDEEALARELATGRFKAVLDVFDDEPLPANSPLRGLKNAILIPHMAGPTVDRRKTVTLALVGEIRNFFEGKPLKHQIGREYAMAMTR
jgi:phosphoglycerate dehydrogenase-like enzyme